ASACACSGASSRGASGSGCVTANLSSRRMWLGIRRPPFTSKASGYIRKSAGAAMACAACRNSDVYSSPTPKRSVLWLAQTQRRHRLSIAKQGTKCRPTTTRSTCKPKPRAPRPALINRSHLTAPKNMRARSRCTFASARSAQLTGTVRRDGRSDETTAESELSMGRDRRGAGTLACGLRVVGGPLWLARAVDVHRVRAGHHPCQPVRPALSYAHGLEVHARAADLHALRRHRAARRLLVRTCARSLHRRHRRVHHFAAHRAAAIEQSVFGRYDGAH